MAPFIFIVLSEYYRQYHFEAFLTAHGMRMMRGHDDTLALVKFIILAVYRDESHAVKAGDKSIAALLMRAYLFSFFKGKKRYAHGTVLRESFADYLSVAVGQFVCKREYFCFFDIFDKRFLRDFYNLFLFHFNHSFPNRL